MTEVPLQARLSDGPASNRLMGPPQQWIFDRVDKYRSTSLIGNRSLLGPYSGTMGPCLVPTVVLRGEAVSSKRGVSVVPPRE
jgi:hypothetical protein